MSQQLAYEGNTYGFLGDWSIDCSDVRTQVRDYRLDWIYGFKPFFHIRVKHYNTFCFKPQIEANNK